MNLDYQAQLEVDDSDFDLVGLGSINDAGDGYTLGLVGRLVIVF